MNTSGSNTQCTPVRRGLVVPAGGVLVHPRWRDSELVAAVKKRVDIKYMGDIGVADFHPTSHTCVIYITENDIISSTNYKRRIAKLRNASGFYEKHVLVDKTELTRESFMKIQDFVVLDCNMNIFPTHDYQQAATLLSQMVLSDLQSSNRNVFANRLLVPMCMDTALLSVVQSLPKIGDTKAKLLLHEFNNLEKLSEASVPQLAKLTGLAVAKQLSDFLS